MWLGAELGIKGNNVTRIEHVLKQALTSLFIAFVTLFGASFEGVHEAGHECGHAGVVMLHGDFTDGNACQHWLLHEGEVSADEMLSPIKTWVQSDMQDKSKGRKTWRLCQDALPSKTDQEKKKRKECARQVQLRASREGSRLSAMRPYFTLEGNPFHDTTQLAFEERKRKGYIAVSAYEGSLAEA
eukprot:1157966-Pelagomonas_calceolata.AAC.1